MNQIKIGIIGVGRMGERYCRIYSNMRQVQLVGVCDINPQTTTQVTGKYEVAGYEHIEDLLPHIDAVCIASPTDVHYDQAMLALESDLHVLVEKPMTETVAQAEDLARYAEEKGRIVLVGHIERFNPAYIELKHILEQMQPLAINLQRLSPYKGSNTDVDVVLDLMIHDVNLVLDLLGKVPLSYYTHGLTAFSGTVDHAVVQLCFEAGPLLTMSVSRVTENKVRKIDVTCQQAYIECDLLNKSISIHRCTIGEYLNHNQSGIKYHQESFVERISVPAYEPLFLELQHFVDCIADDRPPLVSARDGYEALKLTTEIRDDILEQILNMDRKSEPNTGERQTLNQLESALSP